MPSFKKYIHPIAVSLGISVCVAAVVLLLTQDFFFEFTPLKRAELSLIDFRFQKRSEQPTVKRPYQVIIVEISREAEQSLTENYPWPRSYYARLLRNLKRAGAKAVGIDVLFRSPDTRSPENDEDLRRALRETGNAVLAGELETDQPWYTLLTSAENYGNVFVDSEANVGIVNTRNDVDGIQRRYMPFVVDPAREKRIPTFSMAVLNVFFDQDREYTGDVTSASCRYYNRSIPLFDDNSFLINYYGASRTFQRVKLSDVLDDKDFKTAEEISLKENIDTFDDPEFGYLHDGIFKDKIVLVGSTMPEEKDLFNVPIAGRDRGNQMYGVEIHANVIQNILDRTFIARQPFPSVALFVIGISFFTFGFTTALKAIKTRLNLFIELLGFLIVLSELVFIFWASMKLFVEDRYLADMISPTLTVLLSYVGSTVYKYVTERGEKTVIKNMFSHYVNRDVVNELVEHPEKLQLSGERRELTVLFSDIENFTTLAERTKAEELVMFLNDYLNDMTSIIFSNGGTVDKYEGDAIMAFWGAPIPQEEHALLACKSAIKMQTALVDLNRQWKQMHRPHINVRIGVNTGEMIVGNIGGSGKYEYTVIGDSVNLGARLESANKQYRTQILISENTYKKVSNYVLTRELDLLLMAGKTEPIRVHELIGMHDDSVLPPVYDFLELYAQGLAFYRQRKWGQAIEQFSKVLALIPNDYPSQLYIERCQLYLVSPPPQDWNGVFVMLTK